MHYFLIPASQLRESQVTLLIQKGQGISEEQLVRMHSVATFEITRGNKDLNDVLYRCTKPHVDEIIEEKLK